MLNFFQIIVNKVVVIFTTVTIVVTSFFTPSKPIPSIQPTPTTVQQILIQEEITPTQTLLKGSSQEIIVKKRVSPIPTITQIQSNINPTPISSVNPAPSNGNLRTTTNRPKACFVVSSPGRGGKSGYKYSEDVYYIDLPVNLVAACTENVKDIKEFLWYISGAYGVTIKPTGMLVETRIDHIYGDSNAIKSYDIKLEIVGKDGSTDSMTKTIKMKEIPKLKSCITPDSATRRYINFNEEITFSGTCTQDNPENSIIKSYWRFRDGGSGDSIIKEGKEVSHKFTKFAKNFMHGSTGFEAELCVETKWGLAGCSIQHYYPSENDPTIQNLQSCSKQQGKDLDKCIVDLNL